MAEPDTNILKKEMLIQKLIKNERLELLCEISSDNTDFKKSWVILENKKF